jgi:hypothetical protein
MRSQRVSTVRMHRPLARRARKGCHLESTG